MKKTKLCLTLFRMEGKKPPPSTSFSPATSTNVGISPQNFCHTRVKFQVHNLCHSQVIGLEARPLLKKMVFLDKSLWNRGYGNFSRGNFRVTKLWSHNHIYNIIWVALSQYNFTSDVMDRNYDVITFI